MNKRVIVDLDAGTDDAFALILLLEENIDIAAITCTNGNTSLENVYWNVQRILKLCNRTHIPVYLGASKALIPLGHTNHFHGRDGFGDLEYEDDHLSVKNCEHNKKKNSECVKPTEKNPQNITRDNDSNAIIMINKIVTANPGEISLICLGPLTNVALAMRVFPNIAENIRDIFITGGNHRGVGNVTSAAEFNFHIDPEAAYIVLNHGKCPITILPWEPCLESDISFDWRFNVLGNSTHPTIPLLNSAEKRIYSDKFKFWLPCDAFLVAAFLYPEILKEKFSCNASIELQGQKTRAQMVIDHTKELTPNVSVITELDMDLFKSVLLRSFKCNPQ